MTSTHLAYKDQFLEKIGNLVDQAAAFFMLRLHLERLSDRAGRRWRDQVPRRADCAPLSRAELKA
ncbi:hypothetical protein [Rhizobium mesosinicum]|uniref:Transposase n=1 Tax=Rhizobium mesosinicum TaxID=335017 RepID=A0ABS7GRZ5_9HYPH|nr:hypothetical protein [Rhizobium mesosinicum]MBW9052685.1 hypothetical protein [Rhizobium mesosinicum]